MLSFKTFLMRILVCFGLTLSGLLLFHISSSAQNCDPKEIANIPGKWKGPRKGSIDNVSQANLSREREVLAKIHEMMKKSYSPLGGDISFSNVFGYNKYNGKNWLADPYEYSMYFLYYICKRDIKASPNYEPTGETGHTLYISVNEIWSTAGRFNLYAAELPDDHYDGYMIIQKWPEPKNGNLFWSILEPEERYPEKEYQYLITYDGKLPFMPFSKEEYLTLKIPELKKRLAESTKEMESINPDTDSYQKEIYDNWKETVSEHKKMVEETENLLKTMSPEERAQPAIIYAGEGLRDAKFNGFKSENDRNIVHLVKPNTAYYDSKLPKWVPQFICITVKTNIKQETGFSNIHKIEEGIDFNFLKSLLGKTELQNIPTNPATQSIQNTITVSAGTKSNSFKIDIYKPEPTKGFVATPVQQIRNIVKRPEINVALKTAAMAVRITDLNRQEYIRKLFFDIEQNLTSAQLKNTDILLKSAKGNVIELADLGVMLFYKGQEAEALWCLAQAASSNPDNDYILNNLSSILNMTGAPARSLCFLQYLAAKHPTNSTVQNNLGQAWFAINELQKSKAALDTCIKYSPYHPQANYTRAAIAETEGKNAEAAGFIANSIRYSYNEASESFASKKGIKLDYANLLNRKPPIGGDYINPYKLLPPPQCEDVYSAEKLNAEWLAWDEAVLNANSRINGEIATAAANMQNEIGSLINSPSNQQLNITILNKKADKLYHIFLQKLGDLTEEMERNFKTKYNADKEAIALKYSKANKAILSQYPDGEGSSGNSEARCKELNAASTRYLSEMADLNNDFNSRFADPIRQLNIELMRWSQLLGFTESQKLITYYERALFAVSPPGLIHSEFIYPSCIPNTKSKTKKDLELPAPYCPISFRLKIAAVKVTGDCSKFDLEIEVEGLVLNVERDFVNKKSTIAFGAGLSLDMKNENELGVSQNKIIGNDIPQIVDVTGAGVGTKIQGFIEIGPDGSLSDVGFRGEAGIEGGLTDTGDIKVGGKMGVNSGVNVELSSAAQSTSIGKTINDIISTK